MEKYGNSKSLILIIFVCCASSSKLAKIIILSIMGKTVTNLKMAPY